MNSDTVALLLQKGFHVTLGATAALVESLQDPQKREQNLSKLRLEFNELTQDWAQKGEFTEREARAFVDTMLAQRGETSTPTTTVTTTARPVPAVSPEVQLELQALTAQLGAIRAELERLRDEG
jgi:polyhydroxyalkanoate synthesis regulator phasin